MKNKIFTYIQGNTLQNINSKGESNFAVEQPSRHHLNQVIMNTVSKDTDWNCALHVRIH